MKVALVQLDVDLAESVAERTRRACEVVRREGDADLVVLPEIWVTGYFAFDRYASSAEPLDGPTVRALAETAAEAGVYLHGGSIIERSPDGRLYNTSLLFSPDGELVHTQRKFHVFGYRSREAQLLAGADGAHVYRAPFAGVGMTTCYDLRFPELYRLLVQDGAELLIVPASWPAERLAHWQILIRARALENQCYLVACNACGVQNGVALAGHSAVIDPWGRVLAEAGADGTVLRATIELDEVHRLRADFPVLDDRRLFIAATASDRGSTA